MARAPDDRLVYVASPLGFADSTRAYIAEVVAALQSHGLQVEFFIRMHGGEVCRDLGQAAARMAELVSAR